MFRDATPPYTWTGMDAFLSVALLQHRRRRQGNVEDADLVEGPDQAPSYKGKVVMPHPASSGTGYLTIAAWLQMMGEAEALEVHGRAA